MTIFKKPSAIFGVASFVIAAIIGGFFIRNKIISDNLYWKALAEFEENKRRKIRSVEEEIKEIDLKLKQTQSEKDRLDKWIEKQEQDIKKFNDEAEKHYEIIKNLNNYKISSIKGKKLSLGLNKSKFLKPKIQKYESWSEALFKKIKKIKNNNLFIQISELNKLLPKLKKMSKNKKEMLLNYADFRKKLNKQLKHHIQIKNEKENKRQEIEKNLQDDTMLINKLNFLIKELNKNLKIKKEKLLSLTSLKYE